MKLSNAVAMMPASPIRDLVPYARKAKERGLRVLHLNIGDPDIQTPKAMMDVVAEWSTNPVGYADSQGDHELIHSLLGYYHDLGHTSIGEQNIQTTLGGSEGLLWTFLSVCNPGDEIISFEPMYANYVGYAAMVDVKINAISTVIDNNFAMPSIETIEHHITKKTKAILICNPDNPTGAVYTTKDLTTLVGIAKKHGLYLICDEVYREFVYDNIDTRSILSYLDEYEQGIIMVDSLSKRYSLCGARVGCVVSKNEAFMDALLRFGQARLSAGLIDQKMAAALSKISGEYLKGVVDEYDSRRKLLYEGLSKIDGVLSSKPEGALYCIARLPVKDAKHFARWMLEEFSLNGTTVMVAPAAGFYATPGKGTDEVRIAYVLRKELLKEAISILTAGLKEYRSTFKN